MANRNKARGTRFEAEIRQKLEEAGYAPIPVGAQAGMHGANRAYDIAIPMKQAIRRGECKLRKEGFSQLYDWLEGNDFVFQRAPRKPALITMRLDQFLELISETENG